MQKTYLILLNETERAMVEEALSHYHKNHFLGSSGWISIAIREKTRVQSRETLSMIKSFDGATRKIIKEKELYTICSALNWYGCFFPQKKDMNNYKKLNYILENRNKFSYLFDFDPNNYDPKESKPIEKKDFSQISLLIIRDTNDEIDYVSEFHRKNKENDESYQGRCQKKIETNNYPGKWIVIKDSELNKFKISKNCAYFNSN